MDLFSSALSLAVSAADTTTSLYKLCRDWPDCPHGIHELIDDLERANVFFNLIKSGLETPPDNSLRSLTNENTTLRKIGHLLKKEERIIARVQGFSNLLLVDSSKSNQTRRLTWLENCPAINRLRRALKNNVACIYTLLVLEHMIISPETLAALEDVNGQLMSQRRLVMNAHDTNSVGATGVSRRVSINVAHLASLKLHNYPDQPEKLLGDVGQVLSVGHVKYLQTESNPRIQQMGSADHILEEVGDFVSIEGRRASAEYFEIPFTDVGSMAFRAHSMCPHECQCACHGTQSYGSWSNSWLRMVLGSVLISYFGTPFWKGACTDNKCRKSRANSLHWLRASYTLPSWISEATLFAFLSLRPPAPELLLRVINQLPTMSSTEGFWNLKNVIERDDLDSLKFMIASRMASVHDVHYATGQTALHFAIRQENYEMVKILLHAGADPFQGPLSSSAVTALLSRIHTGSQGIKQVSSLFSVTEIMETYGYTDLHKIILGIQPVDLSEAIARSRVLISQVNTPTAAGLTPAHVAAIRGGVAHLAALKQSGSDFSIPTLDKKTALHFACTHNRASSALFILDTTGKRAVNQATSIGMTPLHCIVSSRKINDDMWQVADRLLALGADIDAPATCDVPPLMYAANAGSPKAIEYLLSRGANINARDADGDTALVEAIFSNSPKCVQALLQQGADIKTVNKYGRGPLQYVAGTGSEAIIDMFQRSGAFARANLNKYALDKDGLDTKAIFNKRPSLSVVLQRKFRALLDSIPDCTGPNRSDEEDQSFASISSEDEYFDAE